MFFLLFNLLTSASAERPAMSITVESNPYTEVYLNKTKIICDGCEYGEDDSIMFVLANQHHKGWLKSGKITAVYNDDTIGYAYPDCDFIKNPIGCTIENEMWMISSTIRANEKYAGITIVLFDETGVVIGQSSYTRYAKTKVIYEEKLSPASQTQTLNYYPDPPTVTKVPVTVSVPPVLTTNDLHQAMMMLYGSVR
tara:strand:- start:4095 stop:4682 length:588 start_codon:yes stop_codon:yes gene_type:complete